MQVYNDEELYHFGILGMKWGHHKSGSYGISKDEVHKRIKSSSLENTNKVRDKYKKEINEKLGKKTIYQPEAGKIAKAIGKKHVNAFNDSLLKDINYEGNIKTGRKMLKKYGLAFTVDNQFGVVRKTRFATHIYV